MNTIRVRIPDYYLALPLKSTTGYPFMKLAADFGAAYGDVLLCAEWIKAGEPWDGVRNKPRGGPAPQVEAFKRLPIKAVRAIEDLLALPVWERGQ